jgi:hypothetical protein
MAKVVLMAVARFENFSTLLRNTKCFQEPSSGGRGKKGFLTIGLNRRLTNVIVSFHQE